MNLLKSKVVAYHIDRYLSSTIKTILAVGGWYLVSSVVEQESFAFILSTQFWNDLGVAVFRTLLIVLPWDLWKGNLKKMPVSEVDPQPVDQVVVEGGEDVSWPPPMVKLWQLTKIIILVVALLYTSNINGYGTSSGRPSSSSLTPSTR